METKSHKDDDDEKKAPVCGLCQRLFKSQPSLDHHYRKIHKISAVDGHALQWSERISLDLVWSHRKNEQISII